MKTAIKFIIVAIATIITCSCIYDLPTDQKLVEWYGDTKELGHITVRFNDDIITIITDVTGPVTAEYEMITKDRISICKAKSENIPTVEFIEIMEINNLSMILTWHYPEQCTPIRKELLISEIYYGKYHK